MSPKYYIAIVPRDGRSRTYFEQMRTKRDGTESPDLVNYRTHAHMFSEKSLAISFAKSIEQFLGTEFVSVEVMQSYEV